MSGEQLTAKQLNRATTYSNKKSKVNINDLLYRVREEKTKEKKENYVFLGLVVLVLSVTGILASL
tara:strand:+ start:1361 stop:1555 length:195 start_codon:yes stop_codon:yes gene_type:complete